MINFASLFNQFRSQNNSGLNDLLEQSSTSIGRLLDEDSFINEYKSNNLKIIDLYLYSHLVWPIRGISSWLSFWLSLDL